MGDIPEFFRSTRKLEGSRTCFPECEGMQAEDCIEIIETVAPDAYTTIQYPRSYEWSRVVINVDETNHVKSPPFRG